MPKDCIKCDLPAMIGYNLCKTCYDKNYTAVRVSIGLSVGGWKKKEEDKKEENEEKDNKQSNDLDNGSEYDSDCSY